MIIPWNPWTLVTWTRNRVIAAGVVAVLLVALAVFTIGHTSTTVTARFDSAVGIYENTPVDILGVPVGKVTKVEPKGDRVDVRLEFNGKYDVPADAVAVIVASSLVSDRYVQLAPAYGGKGAKLKDGDVIPLSRTASPAELDDVYAALDKISLALGPNGANKDGSLNTLLQVAAENLEGNGAALGQSVQGLADAATTLANSKDDLFSTVRNLQSFTDALSASDQQVRHFEDQLAQVSTELASERQDLGAALKQLAIALTQVADFVKANTDKIHTDLGSLTDITKILVKQKSSLDETLAVAPVALANIVHAYQQEMGALSSRSNLSSLTDPAQLCNLLDVSGLLPAGAGDLLGGAGGLLGTLTGEIADTCTSGLIGATP